MAEQKIFHLAITKVDGPLFSGDAVSVTVPAEEGEMTVLAEHEPFITPLKAGTITARTKDGEQTFEIEGGVIEINNSVTVLL